MSNHVSFAHNGSMIDVLLVYHWKVYNFWSIRYSNGLLPFEPAERNHHIHIEGEALG